MDSGAPGKRGYCEVTRKGVTQRLASKSMVTLNRGDRVKVFMGGGGGYGDAAQRDAALAAADIEDGMVAAGTVGDGTVGDGMAGTAAR